MLWPTNTKCYCLSLDKRINTLDVDFLTYTLHIQVVPFIAGDGSYPDLNYDYIDRESLPPVYDNSISYPTWWARPNAFNAFNCHKLIIRKALAEKVEWLFLLEDDVIVEDDFSQITQKLDEFLDKEEFDMLYFGAYHNNTSFLTDHEHLLKINGSAGWHAVLMNKQIMEILVGRPPIGPYDWQCGKYIHPDFRCYAIYPSIISQESGFSYVENSRLEKPSRYHR